MGGACISHAHDEDVCILVSLPVFHRQKWPLVPEQSVYPVPFIPTECWLLFLKGSLWYDFLMISPSHTF